MRVSATCCHLGWRAVLQGMGLQGPGAVRDGEVIYVNRKTVAYLSNQGIKELPEFSRSSAIALKKFTWISFHSGT